MRLYGPGEEGAQTRPNLRPWPGYASRFVMTCLMRV